MQTNAVWNSLSRANIESLRGDRMLLDSLRPSAVLEELEPSSKSSQTEVLTIFLTGAECSFRCTMCDLWKHTLDHPTVPGHLIEQVNFALQSYEKRSWIKLYNASNFFDPRAVPLVDLPKIAECCQGFERIIVENHPSIRRATIQEFAASLDGVLEIAMGLETIEPKSMALLKKEFSLDDFSEACRFLDSIGVDKRAFVLLQPPGTIPHSAVDWVLKTLEFAQGNGVRHCSIIPTRGGNGTMEWFAERSLFSAPTLSQLETSLDLALARFNDMIVTADLWNLETLKGSCSTCLESRHKRLKQMNLTQKSVVQSFANCDCLTRRNI